MELGGNCEFAGLILRQNGFRFWALGNFELMKARALANFGCWLLIFPLPAAAILYAVLVWHSWGVPPRYGSYYDLNGFARIHQTLRVTPAMAAGVSNDVWTLEEIVGLLDSCN